AFLVIRNDSIIYENYFNGFNKESLLPSFSVAKSFVGTLTGIAVQEGKVSLDAPITQYIPELKKNDPRFEKITIQQLMDMRSGIKFNEGSYDLKDDAIKLGFRPNSEKQIRKLKIEMPSGEKFNYQSINTFLLGIALERVTGRSLSEYLSEKLWKPAGMEYSATWTIDSKAHHQEIAFAGVNATARDFARLGQLYLKKGAINNHRILSETWVRSTVDVDTMRKYDGYKNQFWGVSRYVSFPDSLDALKYKENNKNTGIIRSYFDKNKHKTFYVTYATPEFHAEGILDEFVYVDPTKNLIIVRLGHNWKSKSFSNALNFLKSLAYEL
ncbi:MAG: serine hydrolase, partial [Ginsengibacter sp.]